MDKKLENLGWDDFFQSQKTKIDLVDFSLARVVSLQKGLCKVKNENGEYEAKVTGKQIFLADSKEDFPAVGDWVVIEDLGNQQAVIRKVLLRKSVIKRSFGDKNRAGGKTDVQIIAANVDIAFIVQAIGRDYNMNRFERYLTILQDGNITPVLVINKTDLISQEELNEKLEEIKNRLGEIEIISSSAVNEKGLSELKNLIKEGKTYCFLGSSGVGKSTLINKLLGDDFIKTKEVSEYSDRGKHTTTSREMYFLNSGGILIDNPGIREVGLTDVGEGVFDLYNEIKELSKKCKFSNCTHLHEPGCAVLKALNDEKLDKEKYSNYVNLKKESDYFKMNKSEKKEKDRNFGKFIKKTKKKLKNLKHKDY